MSSFPFSFIWILYVARDTHIKQVPVVFANCLLTSNELSFWNCFLPLFIWSWHMELVSAFSYHWGNDFYKWKGPMSMTVSEMISLVCRDSSLKTFRESGVFKDTLTTQKQNCFPLLVLLLPLKSPSSSEVEVLNTLPEGRRWSGQSLDFRKPGDCFTTENQDSAISFWLLKCGTCFTSFFLVRW